MSVNSLAKPQRHTSTCCVFRKIRAGLYARMRFFGDASTEDLMEAAERFARLERYERRAFSRRKRAMRLI